MHGRGAGPQSMLRLVEALALDDVHYVIPAAAGWTWYPQRFVAPLAANEPWLTFALDACDALVGRLGAAGRPPDRIALIGFSQGACLTLEYVARHPRRYGTVAALTGGLIGPDGALTRPARRLEGTPVLVTSAEGDEWVPPARTRASAAILAKAGASVDLRVFGPGLHAIRAEEVAALRELIERELTAPRR